MPDSVAVRRIVRNRTYERLSALFAEHGITCLFVPTYYREHRFAPAPPTNSLSTNALGTGGRISQVGPDYLLYPNDHFADLKHLNPRGADRYTRDLAALVAGVIAGGGGSAAPASAR
jgi:hypothetical protein